MDAGIRVSDITVEFLRDFAPIHEALVNCPTFVEESTPHYEHILTALLDEDMVLEYVFRVLPAFIPALLMSPVDEDKEPWMPPFAFDEAHFGLQNFALQTAEDEESVRSRALPPPPPEPSESDDDNESDIM
jgi:hypothetical protein